MRNYKPFTTGLLFRNVFIVESRKHWSDANSQYNPSEDLVLTYDFGLASEAIRESAIWLKNHRKINQAVLGFSENNVAAIRAYTKVGFQIAPMPHIPTCSDSALTMVWNI